MTRSSVLTLLADVSYAGDLHTYRLMLHARALKFHRALAGQQEADVFTLPPTGGLGGRRARAKRRQGRIAATSVDATLSLDVPHVSEQTIQLLVGERITTNGEPFAHVISR